MYVLTVCMLELGIVFLTVKNMLTDIYLSIIYHDPMIKQWKPLYRNKENQVGEVMTHPAAYFSNQPYLLPFSTHYYTFVLQGY